MANVIEDLAGAPVAPVAEVAPSGVPAVDETPLDIPEAPLRVLRGIKSGQLPGATIPENAPPGKSGLTPDGLQAMGVNIYKPHSKGLAGVAYAPEHISEKEVAHLDKAGKLSDVFPDIMKLLGDQAPTGVQNNEGDVAAPDAGASPTPPTTVPVLPRPTFGSDAQARITGDRVNAIQGVEPSKRPLAGAGKVLNGLFARPA